MKNINLTLLFLFFFGILNAQQLINPIENPENLFDDEARTTFESFSKAESMQELKWVQFSSIFENIDEEGYITFSIPAHDEYRMKITRSELIDENNYIYIAERQENDEPTGDDLVLINDNGYIAASIQALRLIFYHRKQGQNLKNLENQPL